SSFISLSISAALDIPLTDPFLMLAFEIGLSYRSSVAIMEVGNLALISLNREAVCCWSLTEVLLQDLSSRSAFVIEPSKSQIRFLHHGRSVVLLTELKHL